MEANAYDEACAEKEAKKLKAEADKQAKLDSIAKKREAKLAQLNKTRNLENQCTCPCKQVYTNRYNNYFNYQQQKEGIGTTLNKVPIPTSIMPPHIAMIVVFQIDLKKTL